jgi:purine-nucleoside phosphorylase
MQQITFPVRVMKMLGIKRFLYQTPAARLNPTLKKGDLMIIEDHINLQPMNPLIGRNEVELGPRFPDMSEPYRHDLIEKGLAIAKANNITCHKGVYVAVTGPNLETRAEYKYLRIIGGRYCRYEHRARSDCSKPYGLACICHICTYRRRFPGCFKTRIA